MKTPIKAAIIALAATPLLALPSAAHAGLAVGARAPLFDTPAAIGGRPFGFSLKAALKKGPVVLYFFPKTFTQGCTIEAHAFAEKAPEFQKLGATVIGMSADTIADLSRFSKEACRDQFAVGIATPAMIKAYGVPLAVMPGRSNRTSFVIAPDGKIIATYDVGNDPNGHVEKSFAAVKAWKARAKR